jgi:hypothetical protein
MSVLGKYRRESDKDSESTAPAELAGKKQPPESERARQVFVESIPNKDRKSPIVSFSIPTDLRECLQAIRKNKAINLSMWVERRLRQAAVEEFPGIAERYLKNSEDQ